MTRPLGSRSHASPFVAMTLAIGLGCGNFSNEGLVFGAPLPGLDLEIVTPADESGQALVVSGVNPRRHAATGAASVNWFLYDVSGRLLDVQSSGTPETAPDGTRRYPPAMAQGTNDWSRLTMTPAEAFTCALEGPDGPPLHWTLEVAEAETGPFVRLAGGTSRGLSGASGCGTFDYDAALAVTRLRNGAARGPRGLPIPVGIDRVVVDWSADGDARGLHVAFEGNEDAPLAGSTHYATEADGRGFFVFAFLEDALKGRGRPTQERVDVRMRWTALDGAGRADHRISGGDTSTPLDGITCWTGERQAPSYSLDPTDDRRPEQGDPATCPADLPDAPPLP